MLDQEPPPSKLNAARSFAAISCRAGSASSKVAGSPRSRIPTEHVGDATGDPAHVIAPSGYRGVMFGRRRRRWIARTGAVRREHRSTLETVLATDPYCGRVDVAYEWGSDTSVIVFLDATDPDLLDDFVAEVTASGVTGFWFRTQQTDVNDPAFRRRRLLARTPAATRPAISVEHVRRWTGLRPGR